MSKSIYLDSSTWKPIKELEKLPTKRLLAYYRKWLTHTPNEEQIDIAYSLDCKCFDCKFVRNFFNYKEQIKRILDKRENI